jgi:formylglycine-generating enzyme required for sulfatase activity
MAGNVSEWCLNVFAEYPTGAVSNHKGPSASDPRTDEYVVRGGSWGRPPEFAGTTRRNHQPPDAAYDDLGFRVVVETGAAYPNSSPQVAAQAPAE